MQVSTTTKEKFRLGTVDEYLGDSDGRFFGNGYRQVAHATRGLAMLPDDDSPAGLLDGNGGVLVSQAWSTKKHGALRPHLSTIDAIVFAARLAESWVRQTSGPNPGTAPVLLQRMEIRAGNTPLEDGLDSFPLAVVPKPCQDDTVSVLDCQVGPMTVTCALARPHIVADHWATTSESGTVALHRLTRRLSLTDVDVDVADRRATAVVTDHPAAIGESGPWASWSPLVECFVAALQLGQVLLYELDGMSRADSSTLWMRRTVLETVPGHPAGAEAFPLVTSLTNTLLVPAKNGIWRTASVAAEGAGVRLRCDVTHRIGQ